MITFSHDGDFKKTFTFLKKAEKLDLKDLMKYGRMGVEALQSATPKDTGRTADSWYYQITKRDDGTISLDFLNSNLGDGWAPIAILIQYGHATGTGGYVEGRDYINPAIQPIFDEIAKSVWKEVMK